MKYHPDKMRNNSFLNPIDFKNIRHAYESLLKKKDKGGSINMLKQLVNQIPADQLNYYKEVLEPQNQSEEEDEDDDYLLEQTLSLNELKQMVAGIGAESSEKNYTTLSKFRAFKEGILCKNMTEEEYVPSKNKLLDTIRLKQPVFQVIH